MLDYITGNISLFIALCFILDKLYTRYQINKYGVTKFHLNHILTNSILYEYYCMDPFKNFTNYNYTNKAFNTILVLDLERIIKRFEESLGEELSEAHKYYLVEFIFKKKIKYYQRRLFLSWWFESPVPHYKAYMAKDYARLPLELNINKKYAKYYKEYTEKSYKAM